MFPHAIVLAQVGSVKYESRQAGQSGRYSTAKTGIGGAVSITIVDRAQGVESLLPSRIPDSEIHLCLSQGQSPAEKGGLYRRLCTHSASVSAWWWVFVAQSMIRDTPCHIRTCCFSEKVLFTYRKTMDVLPTRPSPSSTIL